MTPNKYAALRATVARAKRRSYQKLVMRVTLAEEILNQLADAEKRIAELERMPSWINHCDKTVPAALRYLAENSRPVGGSSSYNTEHLYDLAREIEITAGTAKGE